jgi:hypothetical protein
MDRKECLWSGVWGFALLWLLAACTSQSWKRDPEVQAARRACKGLDYDCIERHAVESLNPDVCHLAGIWIDDMCLQAVYEAAGDPAICEQIYLQGVQPTCRAYYAQRSVPMQQYTDPTLGFSVSLPHHWKASGSRESQDPLGRLWSAIEFSGDLRPYGEQVFGSYGIRVEVASMVSDTLTGTVELGLSPLPPELREQVQILCCRNVGGEEAVEMLNFPPTRWGNRRVVILYQGWEYHLDFYPLAGLSTSTPSGVQAKITFDAFLQSFSFLPVMDMPGGLAPVVSPAPTAGF